MSVKNSKYYLAETYEDDLHTASIVRKDNERILDQEGFSALRFHHFKKGSLIVKLRRLNELVKLALSVKKGDTVIFHFPLLANAYKALLEMMNKRGVQTTALIIDIDGLRYQDTALLKKELEMLQLFSHVIVHNTAMKTFLSQHINSRRLTSIELFDYPSTTTIADRVLSDTICFAGNFEKASFVNDLDKIDDVNFNLYGPSFTALGNNNIFYRGTFSPRTLPQQLQGSFGLVWDGSSIDTCDDYLQFNNPHKFSLYLAAGMPVIVWNKSALADFVRENKIGIVIENLTELTIKIAAIRADEYAAMIANIQPLQEKVSKGYYLRKLLAGLF